MAYPYIAADLIVRLGFKHFATTIKPVGAYVMTQMQFARIWLKGRWGIADRVMRAVHAALGRGFFILLDGHDDS